ncbi:MAG: TonB-dependent receptor, partial [Candidatus Eisenbacteria sp.]|nr:TonB-dependent receptor [Candidatus Eisenbacteria bacterium]
MPPKQCILPVALLALLLQSTLSVDATVSSPTQPAPSDTTDVVTSQPWSTLSDTTDVVTSQPWSTLSDTTDVITSQSWPTPSDTTVVVGSRPSRLEELRLGSSFATRIVVADERGPAEGMADLLERSVGLAIRRYGGPGSIATLSVRGMDPGEVEIFLDHVPLRTASQGMVDLSTIDLAQVESIEIYRSAPPADLGGEVAGAAVRLITRSGGPRHQLGLHSSAGSYGTWTLEAFASGSFKENRYILGAARFRTEGDFLYFNDNGTEHNATDDSWEHWTNGDVLRESLFTRLSRTFRSVGSFDWSSQFWHSDQGLPGTNHQPTHESRLWMRGALHRAEWTAEKHLGGALRIHLYGSLGNEDRHYRDPLRELAVPGASALRADQEQERAGGGLHLAWTLCSISRPWLGIHRFEVLGESRRELLRNLPLPGRSEEDRRRRESGVFSIGECIEVMDDRLRFDLFYRWDRSRDNYTGVNPYRPFEPCPKHTSEYRGPRLGLRARLGQGLILKANYARQARFPTFAELFGYGGAIHSNPTLMPEQSRRMDLGWVWNAPIQPLGMK